MARSPTSKPEPGQLQQLPHLAPGQAAGLSFGRPEKKMGLQGVPTPTASWDGVELDAERLVGATGQGLPIAFSARNSGRLGAPRAQPVSLKPR